MNLKSKLIVGFLAVANTTFAADAVYTYSKIQNSSPMSSMAYEKNSLLIQGASKLAENFGDAGAIVNVAGIVALNLTTVIAAPGIIVGDQIGKAFYPTIIK